MLVAFSVDDFCIGIGLFEQGSRCFWVACLCQHFDVRLQCLTWLLFVLLELQLQPKAYSEMV